VSRQGETLLAPIQACVDAEDYARNNTERTRIVCAVLFNDAGIVGAAMLGKQNA
jgi:glucokinase